MRIYQNGNNWIIEDQLDYELISEISNIVEKNKNSLLKQKEKTSTRGKNAEQYWLFKHKNFDRNNIKDIKFYKFEQKYRTQIFSRIKKANLFDETLKNKVSLNMKNCWSVEGEENSYHTVHNHNGNGCGIATVLYVKVPETNVEDEAENNIFLTMSAAAKSNYYYNLPNVIHINPEVGKLLIFPDWIFHGTYPQTKGIRQTFNLDYGLTIENQKNLNYF